MSPSTACSRKSPRLWSRSLGSWLGAGICLAAIAAACSIETGEETIGSTLEPVTTTVAPQATTTLPPEDRPPTLADVTAQLSELARYDVPLVHISPRPGSESIYLGTREGRIYEIKRDPRRNVQTGTVNWSYRPQITPFFDISAQLRTDGEDRGMHGFAFSSDGSRLYVSFTDSEGHTQVDEFRVSTGRVSPTSQRDLLRVEQEDEAQNAGPLMLGPDGFLYVALGDGGGRDDPFQNAQNPKTLAGSVLRIDPEALEGVPYNVPLDNPFGGDEGAPEVLIIGVRDIASMTFDPATRDLWIAEQGQDEVQEINYLPFEGEWESEGANLGWPLMNGSEPHRGDEPPEGHVSPVFEYGPEQGCAIVGGAVYRGSAIAGLAGAYVFGDRCTGNLIGIKVERNDATGELADADLGVLPVKVDPDTLGAIGTDPDGEIVISTTTGIVYQLTFKPPDEPAPPPAG